MEPDLNRTPPNTPIEPHPHCLYYIVAAQCTSRSPSLENISILLAMGTPTYLNYQAFTLHFSAPNLVRTGSDFHFLVHFKLLQPSPPFLEVFQLPARQSQYSPLPYSKRPQHGHQKFSEPTGEHLSEACNRGAQYRPGEYYLRQLKELPELLIPIKSS